VAQLGEFSTDGEALLSTPIAHLAPARPWTSARLHAEALPRLRLLAHQHAAFHLNRMHPGASLRDLCVSVDLSDLHHIPCTLAHDQRTHIHISCASVSSSLTAHASESSSASPSSASAPASSALSSLSVHLVYAPAFFVEHVYQDLVYPSLVHGQSGQVLMRHPFGVSFLGDALKRTADLFRSKSKVCNRWFIYCCV
jgi:hypothetical protein